MKGFIDMINSNGYNDREAKRQELFALYGKYRGLRALLLTRVSTGSQSHEAQERVIREFLIDLLNLQLDEERHVIHDTYTGLEYRYRGALDEILRMAERREFDVLCLDVLDRGLGRKGVSREIFRGQLRELGIHVLTTEPNDHSDDDSLEGQLMRLLRGYKAEEEVNDFVRRVQNAKRNKALGNPAKGIPPKVIGNGARDYGYKYVRDAKGKIEAVDLNYDVIWVDSKGVEWTEVRVLIFMFRCAKRRIPLRQIAKRLNDVGIPAPSISIGKKYKSRGVQAEKPLWQTGAISRMLRNTTYSGRKIVNGEHAVKIPGKKSPIRVKTPPEEQIIVPVPAIVSAEVQEEILKSLQSNRGYSMRNNQQKVPALLRCGLAICGNCGRKAESRRMSWKTKRGKNERIYYRCPCENTFHKCPGCHINALKVDNAAWEEALKIIHNPSKVDKALAARRSKDPTAGRRKQVSQELAKNKAEQKNIRADLVRMSGEGKLDLETEEAYLSKLKDLKRIEQQYISELMDDEKVHRDWEVKQKKLERLHKKCAIMREKLKNPAYEPDYKEKRDIIEFLGITAIIWEEGHIDSRTGKPQRFKIQTWFDEIELHLS
jgi:hypothetical protein